MGVVNVETQHIAFWVIVEFIAVIALGLVDRWLILLRQSVGSCLATHVNICIMKKSIGLSLKDFEDAEYYDKLTRARREAPSRPISLLQSNLQILRSMFSLVAYGAVLLHFSPWVVISLGIALIPAFICEAQFAGKLFQLKNRNASADRRLRYYEYALTSDEYAKEIKLFGLGNDFIKRYEEMILSVQSEEYKEGRKRTIWTFCVSAITTAAVYGCLMAIVFAAAKGRITIGELALYAITYRQIQTAFNALLNALGSSYENNLYMSNLFEFLTPRSERKELAIPCLPRRREVGIRFDDVCYRYDNSLTYALKNVSFFIPPGSSVAFVGGNGAGKTTLIKLMTGLYRPTSGVVLLDGRDLAEWPAADLHSRFSAIYQDFNRYQVTLRENVGFGSVQNIRDEERVVTAVELGGSKDLVMSLPHGLDTQLGRWFGRGVELSGGQWQKVALSRCFMRAEADILILDEPTAALDVTAEQCIFERFRRLSVGRTSVIISHRFATVRSASKIYVLENGAIVEQGPHNELVAAGGWYAQQYLLQAEGYRDGR